MDPACDSHPASPIHLLQILPPTYVATPPSPSLVHGQGNYIPNIFSSSLNRTWFELQLKPHLIQDFKRLI